MSKLLRYAVGTNLVHNEYLCQVEKVSVSKLQNHLTVTQC